LRVIHSTIVDNSGPGLVTNPEPDLGFGASIFNSIIAGNTPDLVGMPGPTNHVLIGTAPAFRGDGDYHLVAGSLAMDAGDNTSIPQASDFPGILALEPGLATILDQDADGDRRVLDGDGDGTATVDIGYDEFTGPVLSLRIERSGNDVLISWTAPAATLHEAPTVSGPWEEVAPPPTSPYLISVSATNRFYRLRL
jgi:hypothetical protein